MPRRAYVRLDPALPDRKDAYPDGAFRAFVETLCYAEEQADRGYFRNERILRALLGKRSRWIAYLLQQRDLLRMPDGRLYVDGWEEWQEGDWKVSERVARIRSRPKGDAPSVTLPLTVPVTPTVTAPVTAPVTATRQSGGVSVSDRRRPLAEATASKALQQPNAGRAAGSGAGEPDEEQARKRDEELQRLAAWERRRSGAVA